MDKQLTIGFIGLGVMGGPMCRNIALKHAGPVVAFDLDPDAFDILKDTKAECAASIAGRRRRGRDVIFLSLPGGTQVDAVSRRERRRHAERGARSSISAPPRSNWRARWRRGCAEAGIAFADAPVARTREAAQKGHSSASWSAPRGALCAHPAAHRHDRAPT